MIHRREGEAGSGREFSSGCELEETDQLKCVFPDFVTKSLLANKLSFSQTLCQKPDENELSPLFIGSVFSVEQ